MINQNRDLNGDNVKYKSVNHVNKEYEIALREMEFQMQYQEQILQDTRSTHYIFQALFIAISVAIVICYYTLAFTSEIFFKSMDYYRYLYVVAYGVMFILLFGLLLVSRIGYDLNLDYSKNIEKRGLIIDLIHHMSLVAADDRLDELLSSSIFSGSKSKKRFFFTKLIKIAERVINDNYYDYTSYKYGIKENQDVLRIAKEMHLYLKYITIYNDIYSTKYMSESNILDYIERDIKKIGKRHISLARRGHGPHFTKVWAVIDMNLVFMFVIFLHLFIIAFDV